ncbi:MAG: hypothetical protein SOX43_02320 [Pelistega sp.]|nr:hypothetical protein [Pelistega sp.]
MKALKNLLVTSALAFGVAGFAQAQAVDNAPQGKPTHEFGHKKDFKRGGDHQKGFGIFHPRLIQDLNLSAEQKAKYDEIEQVQKSLAETHKDTAKKLADERKSLLSAEIVDLKALLDNGDKFHDEMSKGKDDVRAKTLAFWNSLDNAQKTKVTQSLKERQERWSQFKEKRGDKERGDKERGNKERRD